MGKNYVVILFEETHFSDHTHTDWFDVNCLFIMAMIPGDPAQAVLGPWATPENVARVKTELGLDKPLYHNILFGCII